MTDSLLRPPGPPPSPGDEPGPTAATEVGSGAVVVGVDDGPLPWGLLENALPHPVASGLRAHGSTARTLLPAPPCPVLVLGPRVLGAAAGAEGPRPSGRPSAPR